MILSIQPAMAASIYVLAGYLYKKSGKTPDDFLNKKRIVAGWVVVWIIYVTIQFIMKKGLYVNEANFILGPIDYLGSCAGSVVVFMLSKALPNIKLNQFLQWIGKNSLIVLCFHLIEMDGLHLGGIVEKVLNHAGFVWPCFVFATVYFAKIVWVCCAVIVVKRTPLKLIFERDCKMIKE